MAAVRRYKFVAVSQDLSPYGDEALHALERILLGARSEDVESETLDCKEDPSRRGPHGELVEGTEQHDEAARIVADAAACLANHFGGVVLVGVDDGQSGPAAVIGTRIDAEWLRQRVAELTTPRLVVACSEHVASGNRVLFVEAPRNESSEPHAVTQSKRGGQRRARRLGTQCQEMATVAEMLEWARNRMGWDWSAEPSGRRIDAARPAAIDALRDFLRDSGEPERAVLADLDDQELLHRLQILRPDGRLTRAGELLLCPGNGPRLRLAVRPVLGAKSASGVAVSGRGLAEELQAVLAAFQSTNRIIAIGGIGLAEGAVEALPFGAVREALVNAVMHRDWLRPGPIAIDLAQDELIVYSPGGFLEGVNESTVLTAPSRTRNPQLGDVLRSLRVAEREGTGVDRMYIELIRLGHAPPSFAERDAGVRVALQGGDPVPEVLRVHAALPPALRRSARSAVVIDILRTRPSVTAEELAVAAQERAEDLASFLQDSVDGGLLQRTANPRPHGVAAWRLTDRNRDALGSVLPYFARPAEESVRLIAGLARSQGDVRNQDVQDLLGLTSARASQLLKRAEADGVIRLGPGAKATGRGTYYVPIAEVLGPPGG
jgi:ATP-dependent DNA helicase RecG